jgi:putative membrane protein
MHFCFAARIFAVNQLKNKNMFYNGYHFFGMHLGWWFIWIVLMFWIFATPYYVPFQEQKKNSPLDILKKRFAAGEITKEEFLERKMFLDNN